MLLDIMDVLRTSGKTIERPISIEPVVIDDLEIVEPVSGVVRARNARRSVVLDGQAQTVVRMRCARCLREFEQSMNLELESVAPLSFFRARLPGHQIPGHFEDKDGEENEEADDELAAVFESHHADVLELVRQAIFLQAPIAPLCSADCPGLPQAAQYSGGAIDDRWSALQKLVENDVGETAIGENSTAASQK